MKKERRGRWALALDFSWSMVAVKIIIKTNKLKFTYFIFIIYNNYKYFIYFYLFKKHKISLLISKYLLSSIYRTYFNKTCTETEISFLFFLNMYFLICVKYKFYFSYFVVKINKSYVMAGFQFYVEDLVSASAFWSSFANNVKNPGVANDNSKAGY